MAVTVQMQFESAVTEMYQNAFVGSSIENGTTIIQFDLRKLDFQRALGTTSTRDRLTTQLIELTIYVLTFLGPSEGVPTSLRSARSTPTAHRGNALCACRLGKVDNSSKVA